MKNEKMGNEKWEMGQKKKIKMKSEHCPRYRE